MRSGSRPPEVAETLPCAEDSFASVEHGKYMAERIPWARLVVLDDCGHLPTIKRPDEANGFMGIMCTTSHAQVPGCLIGLRSSAARAAAPCTACHGVGSRPIRQRSWRSARPRVRKAGRQTLHKAGREPLDHVLPEGQHEEHLGQRPQEAEGGDHRVVDVRLRASDRCADP